MIDPATLARSHLLDGLERAQLQQVVERARPRHFGAGEALYRAGDPADRCFIITGGLVDVLGPSGEGPVARHRRGDTLGDVAAVLRESHAETAVAGIPATALELAADDLHALVERVPRILVNVLRQTHQRLVRARARGAERNRGETVALAAGPSLRGLGVRLAAQAKVTARCPVTVIDRELSFAGALTAADDLLGANASVLLACELEAATLQALLREADRVVALAGTAEEAHELGRLESQPEVGGEVEAMLLGGQAIAAAGDWREGVPVRIVRRCGQERPSGPEMGWMARHLTRTKLGLALGAGGAKGYAHVGVLEVLEEAGYVVDCVAGSSIGAIVGTQLALGASARRIDEVLREAFTPDAVAEIFRPSLSGRATGLELLTRILRRSTGERTFADTSIPLAVMAVDLTDRAAAPLREGLLWEALLAATALAGVFPPHERDGHRLVDGLALVPVPTDAVIEDGADITVAVNLIGRRQLPAWPEGSVPEPPRRRQRGLLDSLLEVMDLSQLSESERHTEQADVPITPEFGPGEWRDFHLADQFRQAGREAAKAQLPQLQALALPAKQIEHLNRQGGEVDRADPVRV